MISTRRFAELVDFPLSCLIDHPDIQSLYWVSASLFSVLPVVSLLSVVLRSAWYSFSLLKENDRAFRSGQLQAHESLLRYN